jgi:hypothetical protein
VLLNTCNHPLCVQVLLDLTVHQEQIISLFHHQILMSARQQLLQQQQQQLAAKEAATTPALAATAGAGAADGQTTPFEFQQQLQRLHQQLLQQVKQQHGLQDKLQTSCSGSADAAEAMEEDVEPPQAVEGILAPSYAPQQQQHQLNAGTTCCAINAEEGDDKQQQQQQQQQQSHPASCSYVGGLLQAVATDEAAQQRVLAMTAVDWSKFFSDSFYKLLLLLELADRSEECLQAEQQPPPQQQQQQPTTSEKRPARHSSSASDAADIQQQQVAGPAAGGAAAAAAAAAAGVDLSCGRHMQQLEQLIDEWVTLSALSLILNPLPVYVACTINHATQQPCAAPVVSGITRFIKPQDATLLKVASDELCGVLLLPAGSL